MEKNNVFIGSYAGFDNTSGNDNIFIGNSAGGSNQTGYSNTMIGNFAGNHNSKGIHNSYFGTSSGSKIDSGSYNICLGARAGPNSNNIVLSERLFIDVNRSDNPLLYGEFDNDLIRINGKLEVTKNIQIDSNSLVLQNLGTVNNKGVIWSEDSTSIFGFIYDGIEARGQ